MFRLFKRKIVRAKKLLRNMKKRSIFYYCKTMHENSTFQTNTDYGRDKKNVKQIFSYL